MKNKILLIIFFTIACSLQLTSLFARASKIEQNPSKEKMEQRQWSETFGGPAQPGTELIRDSEGWKNLWAGLGLENPPPADFSKQMAAAIFLGSKPTGGWSVRVEKIEKGKKRWVLHYKEKAPEGFVIQAFTSPYTVVLLERTDLPVIFKKIK